MGLNVVILPVVTEDLPISPRFTPYKFSSRCKFSTLTTRQPMVEFCLQYSRSDAKSCFDTTGSENIEATLRRRRILFAGSVAWKIRDC